jgi:ribosomal protein S8
VVNDTISDMLTRIQKCQYGKTSNCSNSSTKMSLAIAKF